MSKLVSPEEMHEFLMSLPTEVLEEESRKVKEHLSRVTIDWYEVGYEHGYSGYNIKGFNLNSLSDEQRKEYKEGELQGSIEYWAEIDSMDDEF